MSMRATSNRFGDYLGGASLTRLALAFVVAALFVVQTAPPASAASKNKHAVAVIIGNKNYSGKTPQVDFAHNDAAAIKRYVLEVLGYREGNIIDLRDASKADMEATFGNTVSHEGRLFDWVRPGQSDVFIFYSGHGVPGLKDKRPYLLPVDSDANQAEITGFSVDVLYKNLAKVPAKTMTVMLDACFSGETPKGMIVRATSGMSISAKLPEVAVSAKMTVLTAAQGDQFASWDEDAKHGLFTRYLLDALYGAADGTDFGNGDGRVTLAEIRSFLDDEMSYSARRKFGRQQTASIQGDDALVVSSVIPGGRPDMRFANTPTPRKVAAPAPQPVAAPAPRPVAKPAVRVATVAPAAPVVKPKPKPQNTRWRLDLVMTDGGNWCNRDVVETIITLTPDGFKGKGGHFLGIQGEFDRRNKNKITGDLYTNLYGGSFDMLYRKGKWTGNYSLQAEDSCDGTITMTRY